MALFYYLKWLLILRVYFPISTEKIIHLRDKQNTKFIF